jgi:hypothetical protein
MAKFFLLVAGLATILSVNAEPGPISKVIHLLKDMQKELEQEAKEEKETYETMKCWCDKNNNGKMQAVKEQKDKIDELNALIEGSTSKRSELETEIDQLKKDIVEAEKALAEATEIRKKQAAEFHEEETELLTSIKLLKGAIVALSKHHTGLLQSDSELAQMQPALRKLVHSNLKRLNFLTVSNEKDAFLSFINANEDILEPDTPVKVNVDLDMALLQRDSMPVFKSYGAQSGQIYGVLKQMKEAFELDLPEIQKEEAQRAEAFALMKGEKESEIAEYKTSVKDKQALLATTKEELVVAKADLRDVKASLDADQKFLLELIERCTQGDAEWERRQKMRADEIAAVSQAIVILDTDEVRDGQQQMFRSFLQRSSRSTSLLRVRDAKRRARAVALLSEVVGEAPALALILRSTKKDPFKKVIEAIDALAEKLKLEMEDEVKHRDFCVEEFHENQVDTEKKQAKLENLEAELNELAEHKKAVEETIANLKQDIADTQVEMQRAAEDRKAENIEFQKIVADQIRTIGALKAAHAKLGEFYFKNSNLIQKEKQPSGAAKLAAVNNAKQMATKPGFEDYKSNGQSNKVMNLLQKLMGEAQVIKDSAVSDEQNAETAYVKLVTESNAAIKAKMKAIVDKTEELAETEQRISVATIEKDQTLNDLESLAATKAELHAQCDFLLKNFDLRQKARAAELDAIAEVKAILSGMK